MTVGDTNWWRQRAIVLSGHVAEKDIEKKMVLMNEATQGIIAQLQMEGFGPENPPEVTMEDLRLGLVIKPFPPECIDSPAKKKRCSKFKSAPPPNETYCKWASPSSRGCGEDMYLACERDGGPGEVEDES